MSVQALYSGCDRETGSKSGGTEFSCTAAWSKNGANCNILNEIGVVACALTEGFEGAVKEVGSLGVFQTSLTTFGERSTKGTGDDDL